MSKFRLPLLRVGDFPIRMLLGVLTNEKGDRFIFPALISVLAVMQGR